MSFWGDLKKAAGIVGDVVDAARLVAEMLKLKKKKGGG